jgi:PAS domain S-box-containing protein
MKTRILVIDGDIDMLRATSHLLRSAGYEVMEASTGGDGLRLTTEEEPDLILLDVMLPDMDGLEVCRQVKANSDLVGSFVVLLSAFRTASEDQVSGLEAGADDYIARPITSRELLAHVEAMLRLKRTEDALRERTRQLDQRVKELNCLYGISQLREKPDISLDETLQGTVNLIATAWQYPEVACACIILGDQVFKTDRFQETAWRQACEIKAWGSPAGRVEVYYLGKRPELDKGPFLEEERKLLYAIAERLGKLLERMQTEVALRESEEKFRGIFEQSQDGITLTDERGLIIDWNQAMEEITGLKAEDVLGKPVWDVQFQVTSEEQKTQEGYRQQLKGMVLQALESGQAPWLAQLSEHEYQYRDGTRRFMQWVTFPIRTEEGFMMGSICRDITERVQAEEALRDSEQKYRNLFEQTLIGIVSSGRDGRISAVNPAVVNLLGYRDQEELVGQPAETIWFDPAERSRALQVARELGYLPVQEVKLKRKDGISVYGLATAIINQDKEGQFLGVTATFTDISQLKEAEQALQRSEQRYGRLLETLQEGIWIIDQDARTTFANPRLAEMLGYSVEEIQGKTLFDFTDERGVELCNYYLERRQRGIKEQHDFEFLRKNGERMYVSMGTSPIFDDDGNYAGAVAGVQDISDRIQTEEALAERTRLLATIFEHTPMLIAYLDPEFNFVSVNRAYAEADEREPSFFPAKNHFDLYPNPENEDIFRRVVETGQPYFTYARPFEYAEHPERGVSFWDWSLIPIKDEKGALTGLILTLADVTERVQAQEALWASEQRYRNLFEQTLIGVISSGRDDHISTANPAILNILGYRSQEELVGQPTKMTWFDSEARSKVIQVVKDIGYHPVTEVRLKRKDGTPVHVLTTSVLDRDKDGEFLGVTGTFTDITDRKQAEKKLQWELSVDAALSALYEPLISPLSSIEEIAKTVLDQVRSLTRSAHGYVSAIDPVTGDNIGYTLTEMLKDNCKVSGEDKRITFPRGSDGRYPRLWGHSLNTGEAFYTNSPEMHSAYRGTPEGHIPIQQFLSVPVMLGEELVGQIAACNPGRDYTEQDLETVQRIGEFYALAIQRKRAQAALQQSEEKYRDLVEEINDVIYAIDTNGVITYINPAIESFTGHNPSEIIGQPFVQFIAPEDLAAARNNFEQVISGTPSGPNEYRVMTKSGEVRWMRISSRLVVEGDQITGVRGMLADITDQKRAEEQLEQAATTAERERLARELHDAVTQVLFSASLIADTLPRVWERHPEEGQCGLEELRRLTHGALAEMRTLLLELRPGALSEQKLGVLLRQLTDGMMARTRMPVTTTVAGDNSLPTEVRIALYRIAQEALNNIAKHARASQATVSLDNEPDCVTLRISDDGRGFDPSSVQAHQLGMKIMHERAQAIGASFKATSQPGQGTEIVVMWPGDDETDDEGQKRIP